MSELQQKIELVQDYLWHMGKRMPNGSKIRIVFKNQDNTIELQKLEHAFMVAYNYFKNL